jgi:Helix-turn-helix domain
MKKKPSAKAPAVVATDESQAPVPVALFSSRQARRYLGISNSTLKRLEARGILRPLRFIRARRYPLTQLDAILRDGLTEAIANRNWHPNA